MSSLLAMRSAAVLTWIGALGLGLGCVLCIQSLLAGRGIAMWLGYPTYGHGPFERADIPTTVRLVTGFLIICVLECVAGGLLWRNLRAGAVLALGLVPLGAIYWWGFALPYPPIVAVVRVALILMAWRNSVG